ncbi:hypothetical protein PR048_014147 [Dryococelus australis]|uniref:Uncharacterized protein n=1 Tax=Dryococelus australis TaxID=614101 RepID=A0ABQ9HDC6_9NEOP|nr:hypothetical protein PR048_014147 [Dryococelus australis]
MQGRGKREIPQKTIQPATSSGMIPTYENAEWSGRGLNPVRVDGRTGRAGQQGRETSCGPPVRWRRARAAAVIGNTPTGGNYVRECAVSRRLEGGVEGGGEEAPLVTPE